MAYSKYKARPTTIDGIRFQSKHEAQRYCELLWMVKAGEIDQLQLQVVFKLGSDERPVLLRSERYPNGRRAKYLADFVYRNKRGQRVVEDAKGIDTPASKLKRAVVEAQYGVQIELI